jgi:hypothetical protein
MFYNINTRVDLGSMLGTGGSYESRSNDTEIEHFENLGKQNIFFFKTQRLSALN